MKQTAQAFVVSLSENLKEYSIIEIEPMNEARSGHSLVFHAKKQMVFAVGGMKEDIFSRSAEVFSIEHQKWYKLSNLNVERTQTTAFCHQDSVYVVGGLTPNEDIH